LISAGLSLNQSVVKSLIHFIACIQEKYKGDFSLSHGANTTTITTNAAIIEKNIWNTACVESSVLSQLSI